MGILTGYKDVDKRIGNGLQNGFLYLIAARPAMGKTSFILNIMDHICTKQKKAALMFSCELSRRRVMDRLISIEGNIDCDMIREGRLSGKEWEGIIKAADAFKDAGFLIHDDMRSGVDGIRSLGIEYKQSHKNLSVILVDYIQLLCGSDKYDNGKQEIADILSGLKRIATELDIPVVALSQLPRSVEMRDEHRPQLSDLWKLGVQEKHADVIFFLYRDEVYDMDTEDRGIAEIICAKNPGGAVGTCRLRFMPEYGKFIDML